MKMAFPSLMTLLESSIFTFQHIKYLAISKHTLFIYTILHVNMKTAMTTTTKNSIVTPALFWGRTEWVCFGCQVFIIRKVKPSSNGTGSPASETCSACRDSSAVKTMCCSCRGPEPGSQHKGQLAHMPITPTNLTLFLPHRERRQAYSFMQACTNNNKTDKKSSTEIEIKPIVKVPINVKKKHDIKTEYLLDI